MNADLDRARWAARVACDRLAERGPVTKRETLPKTLGERLIPESKRAPCEGQLTIEDA